MYALLYALHEPAGAEVEQMGQRKSSITADLAFNASPHHSFRYARHLRAQQRHEEGPEGQRPAREADALRERAGRARPRAGAHAPAARCQSRACDARRGACLMKVERNKE